MNIGDKVVWYRQVKYGRIVSFTKNIGTIEAIDDDVAKIVTIAGGRVRKPVKDLILKASDTPLAILGYASDKVQA